LDTLKHREEQDARGKQEVLSSNVFITAIRKAYAD
jgi:hypothetical protein